MFKASLIKNLKNINYRKTFNNDLKNMNSIKLNN